MPEDHTGFTGTRSGLTHAQAAVLARVVRTLTGWCHHGDCVGCDAESHLIAEACGLKIEVHPSIDSRFRHGCVGDIMHEPKPYLVRDKDIVLATKRLIATPRTPNEERRSGTWATIRYARKMTRPILIILPNGALVRENRT